MIGITLDKKTYQNVISTVLNTSNIFKHHHSVKSNGIYITSLFFITKIF